MLSVADLTGAWRLTSHYFLGAEGSTSEGPLGAGAAGLLVYDADGYISVGLMRTVGGPHQAAGPAAFYMGYSGRWRLAGGMLVHEVEISSHPHIVDTTQVREAHLDDDELILRERLDETPRYFVLRWRRAGRNQDPDPPGSC
ncbi:MULTISPECIES: lipocalin-like domain-containing protein [unclassified Pseudofrankia]|uniref:lipocalin-like domain-containing protein n=1 Tax=unclassified Pseudofrankia TaxID=2994372 RepID=UPI0008DAC39A|nr:MULTISPECIES: lipocalin-like domain-containing protein [unclassified Pseudofrankia]MDT3442575.1 lipocalin-like domain-containing protein [Pseudofrankia sp. BMG5.37]OHV71769.1 hypothetical protein BCD48_34275 [Pseudofrankia sp. BMG5.36]